jgi:hypothetical protein
VAPEPTAPLLGPQPSDQPIILVTTVDIGEGQSDCIEVRQGDDPLDLARAFVNKHALPIAITDALAQHLRDNLQEAADAADAQTSAGGTSEGLQVRGVGEVGN